MVILPFPRSQVGSLNPIKYMTFTKAQDEVMKLAKAKGFPRGRHDIGFLTRRIHTEVWEVLNATGREDIIEECVDVIIQSIQAIAALGGDVQKEFRKKMDKNWKREWN